MTCDPYWDQVQLLVTFDGTQGSTTFTDLSNNAYPLTVAGSGPSVDTSNPKFGTGSYVNSTGDNSTWISTPDVAHGGIDLSGGPFTIECWFRTSFGYDDYFCGTATTGFQGVLEENGLVYVAVDTTGGALAATSTHTYGTGAWHSLAAVFDGTYLNLYIDGNLDGQSSAISGTLKPWVGTFEIGAFQNSSINTQTSLDEFRITEGVARYTSNYTPAAVAFPTVACVTVPDVTGDTLITATSAIVGVGLVVGTVNYAYNAAPVGTVYSQVPVGGSTVSFGSAVDLNISLGLPPTPDIIGDTLTTATAAIIAAGFIVGQVGYVPDMALVGTVVDQNPPPGDPAASGSPVDFDISLGSAQGGAVPNILYDEAIYGAYFGGQLNLVEFTYMPGRTPFEEGATNLIINRYKQEPTDTRQRGVDFTQFVVPGELLQTVSVTGISAQGVPQTNTSPLVTPLIVANVVIDPVTSLKFGYTVSGGQNGVEYTIQFTCTTNIQSQTLEEVFSINIMIEDMFP